jgi:hypothetical protein
MGIRGNLDASSDNFSYTPLDPSNAQTPFRDSFNLSTGSSLSPFWGEQTGAYSIANKKLVGSNTTNLAALNGIMLADVAVQAMVDVTAGSSAGLVARHQGIQDTNMYLGQLVNRDGSFFAMISRNVNGKWTRLAEVAVGSGAGLLRFEAVDSSLRLYLDGVEVASATDSTFLAPGQVGLRSVGDDETFDDFFVEAI